jgi:predicted O-methyltransferase YrrM
MQEITQIEEYAKEHAVPIIKEEGSEFICKYIRDHNVKKILEIGTAIAYSSIKFAKQAEDIFVTTVEYDIDRYHQAVKNILDNNLMDRITVYLADAATLEFNEKFDLIFIDGPKAQNLKYFEKFKHNLADGGVIVTDNLSFHGMVEDLSLTHNYSTKKLVKKIRKYIKFLEENQEFETEFFDIGDRISFSKKRILE